MELTPGRRSSRASWEGLAELVLESKHDDDDDYSDYYDYYNDYQNDYDDAVVEMAQGNGQE